jgi:aminopeptidase N/puromycin-sensitive aminopeptidase
VPPSKPLFANAGGKSYYRSAYTPAAYAALVAGIETNLTPPERISFIGDEWAQLRANKATVGDYLGLAATVRADPNAPVVQTALGGVTTIYEQVAYDPGAKAALSTWIRTTFSPQYAKIGAPAESDSPNTRELRAQYFGILGDYGKDPLVLAQAQQIADRYLTDQASVDATLAKTALSVAARNGGAAFFDRLQKIFETSANPDVQITALRLLAQFQDPTLVQRSLDYAVSGKVRNQDAAIQFVIALDAEETRDQAWKYIKANWDKVKAQFTTELGGYVVGATGNFCSAGSRDDVQAFFSTHKVAASDLAFKHAIERIDGNVELRTLQEPNLKRWLATQPKE